MYRWQGGSTNVGAISKTLQKHIKIILRIYILHTKQTNKFKFVREGDFVFPLYATIRLKILSMSAKVGTPLNSISSMGDCPFLPFSISLLNAYILNLS